MSRQLRVLQILTGLDRGGMETMTMNYYRNIDRARVQFDFLLHREKVGDYEAEALALGAQIFRVPRQNPLNPGYWHALNRFFDKHNYQIVHVQLDCMSALPLFVAKSHGIPVRIAHSHNSRQDKDIKYPLKLLCKHFIRHEATDLLACGVDAGRWMFGTDNFTVLKNAISVDDFAYNEERRSRVRMELGIARNAFVVGHVGRFVPSKNHSFILEVFSTLLSSYPNAVLLLVGNGELRLETERLTNELGIADSVRFLGVRSDVPDIMQAMDVFFMPSLYEGLPLVLVEAQAAGLPCVISDSIPVDCDIDSRLIFRFSLDESRNEWAKAILSQKVREESRSAGSAAVRCAGFDIKQTTSFLEQYYYQKIETTI